MTENLHENQLNKKKNDNKKTNKNKKKKHTKEQIHQKQQKNNSNNNILYICTQVSTYNLHKHTQIEEPFVSPVKIK